MSIYSAYQEAVIANGSVKGVSTDGKWFYTTNEKEKYRYITPCNPADYLENMHDFFEKGLKLVNGDKYTGLSLHVYTVGVDVSESQVNARINDDNQRYVVKAAAYDTETPEEKEAFDAMTDTVPQQFESLSKDEWKNGDPCVFGDCDLSGVYVAYDNYNCGHIIYGGGEYHYVLGGDFRKPETPEQRAERERDEAIDEMMNFTQRGVYSAIQRDLCAKLYDAGYRKEK